MITFIGRAIAVLDLLFNIVEELVEFALRFGAAGKGLRVIVKKRRSMRKADDRAWQTCMQI